MRRCCSPTCRSWPQIRRAHRAKVSHHLSNPPFSMLVDTNEQVRSRQKSVVSRRRYFLELLLHPLLPILLATPLPSRRSVLVPAPCRWTVLVPAPGRRLLHRSPLLWLNSIQGHCGGGDSHSKWRSRRGCSWYDTKFICSDS